jgi:anti-sigma regulatory factor (Ser/Thr protein kinase)
MTAVVEIATNILRHAYPPGTPPGSMELRLLAFRDRVEARFSDHGTAFQDAVRLATARVPDPAALAEGGYGLALARATLDRLEYTRSSLGRNSWLLAKQL